MTMLRLRYCCACFAALLLVGCQVHSPADKGPASGSNIREELSVLRKEHLTWLKPGRLISLNLTVNIFGWRATPATKVGYKADSYLAIEHEGVSRPVTSLAALRQHVQLIDPAQALHYFESVMFFSKRGYLQDNLGIQLLNVVSPSAAPSDSMTRGLPIVFEDLASEVGIEPAQAESTADGFVIRGWLYPFDEPGSPSPLSDTAWRYMIRKASFRLLKDGSFVAFEIVDEKSLTRNQAISLSASNWFGDSVLVYVGGQLPPRPKRHYVRQGQKEERAAQPENAGGQTPAAEFLLPLRLPASPKWLQEGCAMHFRRTVDIFGRYAPPDADCSFQQEEYIAVTTANEAEYPVVQTGDMADVRLNSDQDALDYLTFVMEAVRTGYLLDDIALVPLHFVKRWDHDRECLLPAISIGMAERLKVNPPEAERQGDNFVITCWARPINGDQNLLVRTAFVLSQYGKAVEWKVLEERELEWADALVLRMNDLLRRSNLVRQGGSRTLATHAAAL